jgi:hypothetical protein
MQKPVTRTVIPFGAQRQRMVVRLVSPDDRQESNWQGRPDQANPGYLRLANPMLLILVLVPPTYRNALMIEVKITGPFAHNLNPK